jgi:hemoglobin-like flavoprotein
MGGGISMPHCCPFHAVREQAAKMIAELPRVYLQQAVVTVEDLDVADASWYKVTHDKELLSRFFDAFFRISAELGDQSVAEAHGSGLKTKSKFIVEVFGDSLKILRGGDQAAINKKVEENCHHYLVDMGLRVPQYVVVGQVMMRTFEECANPYWTERDRVAWRNIVSVVIKLLVRIGLQVEAKLTPEELASVGRGKAVTIDDKLETYTAPSTASPSENVREFSGVDESNNDSARSESTQPAESDSMHVEADPKLVVYDDACWEG